MPLIRYVTDDVIQVQEDGSYKLIGHRKSEVKLIGKNGFPIFKGAMTLHMAETQKVRAYQYVQNEIGKVELHIVEEVICDDKDTFDFIAAKKKLSKNMKKNFYKVGREYPYKNVKPRIIAERLLL